MSGHIMTTAEVAKILTSENNRQIWFKVQDSQLMKYILYKGFIGIDGISLTVGEVSANTFLRPFNSGNFWNAQLLGRKNWRTHQH